MKAFSESLTPFVIAWVVLATVIFSILLPFFINIPVVPVILFNAVNQNPQNQSYNVPISIHASNNEDGPLVHYDFQNYVVSSRQIVDVSGNGYNAVLRGPFLKAGTVAGNGPAIAFPTLGPVSGLYQIRTMGNPAAGTRNVSFVVWFRTPQVRYNSDIASAVSTGLTKTGWSIGTLEDSLWDDNGKTVYVNEMKYYGKTPKPAPDTWTMKVVTYNGSTVINYLDGAETGSWPATGAALGSGGDMMLGSLQPFGYNFVGEIEDFRIYGYALDSDEVAALYREKGVPKE